MAIPSRIRVMLRWAWNIVGALAVLNGALQFVGAPADVRSYWTWISSLPPQVDPSRFSALGWVLFGLMVLFKPTKGRVLRAYQAIRNLRFPVLVIVNAGVAGEAGPSRENASPEPPVESEGFIWKRGFYWNSDQSDLFPHCKVHGARLLFRYDEGFSGTRLPYEQYRVIELRNDLTPDDPASGSPGDNHLFCPGGNGDPGHSLGWFSDSYTVGDARLVADMHRKRAIQERAHGK